MNNIEKLRRDAKLTQVEVASVIGVTQGTVSQWENGLSFPRANKLLQLSRLLGCSIEALYEEPLFVKGCEHQ